MIFGMLLFQSGDCADGMAAMRAASPTTERDAAEWTEGRIGIGGLHTAAPNEEAYGGPPLHFDRDAGLTLAADARIDDREGLCERLRIPHPERPATSDGDLILRAYARWGRECPDHLCGDFAFAVWDARQHTLFCARDHIGARPFYYALSPARFVFASAMEAVLAAPDVSEEWDESVVATFLTQLDWQTHMRTRTFFKMVRKLPAGHSFTVEAGPSARSTRPERYWRPERTPEARPGGDDDYAEAFLDLYAHAVKDRLRGGPVGVHLSGGLDSSSIAVLAARELRRRGLPSPPAFSWLPPLGAAPPHATHAPEYARIDAVCAREGLRVTHCQTHGPHDVVAQFRRSDPAFPHCNPIEQAVQQQATKLGVRVLLSGLGGDEGISFNGRGYDAHLLLCGRWGKLAAECRTHEENPIRFLARIAASLVHPSLPGRVARWRQGRPRPRGGRWLIHPTFARQVRPLPQRIDRHIGVRRTQLQALHNGHLSAKMENHYAAAARHTIEYRYPLLDRRILEFTLGLPAEQFRRGRWNRWLMRFALRSVLPPEVCWRRDKKDPARSEPAREAFTGAFPALRQEILVRAETMARARYVDIPRLLDRLDADRFRARPRPAPITKALAILISERSGP